MGDGRRKTGLTDTGGVRIVMQNRARQAVGVPVLYPNVEQMAQKTLRSFGVDGLHPGSTPDQLSRFVASPVEQHRLNRADLGAVEGDLLGIENLLQGLQAV